MTSQPDLPDIELMVELDAEGEGDDGAIELAADRLWQAGATAVGLHDRSAVASFPTDAAARLVVAELAAEGASVRLLEADPDWRDAWRDFANPVEVGTGLVVAPAWRDVPVGDDRMAIRIDPGPCFGSGTHPSTRLILTALDRQPPAPGDRVLDAGCGSGVLSVAAALLGAGHVTAVDIDPDAVDVTAANAEANGVADRVHASVGSASGLVGRFDLALVNVTAGVHAEIGPAVVSSLSESGNGRIILAGLLPGQWRHVEAAYAGASVVEGLELDGWEGAELVIRPNRRR